MKGNVLSTVQTFVFVADYFYWNKLDTNNDAAKKVIFFNDSAIKALTPPNIKK